MIGDFLAWVMMSFYIVSFLFQARKNYLLKTAKGLSDYFLFVYFTGFSGYLYYSYCLNLPRPYLLLIPFETLTFSFNLAQRFYYDGFSFRHDPLSRGIVIGCILNIFAIPFALQDPVLVGQLGGWIMLASFSVNQIPQIVKIYRSQSVAGFSFWFITTLSFAMSLELVIALLRDLPVQTLLMGARGVMFYLIYAYAFWKFGKKSTLEEQALEGNATLAPAQPLQSARCCTKTIKSVSCCNDQP